MAGSIKWHEYTDDDDNKWAYKADESNLESVVTAASGAAGTGDYTGSSTAVFNIPRNLRPRSALFRNASGTVSRRVIIPTQALFALLAVGQSYTDPVSSQTVTFVSKRGEELTVPFAEDTALNDGDAT